MLGRGDSSSLRAKPKQQVSGMVLVGYGTVMMMTSMLSSSSDSCFAP